MCLQDSHCLFNTEFVFCGLLQAVLINHHGLVAVIGQLLLIVFEDIEDGCTSCGS